MSKKDIKVKSRYGAYHTLQHMPEEGDNIYRYTPAEEWMPMRYGYDKYDDDAEINELKFVDTDGGPWLSEGSEVEGRTVKRIYSKKDVGILLELD